MFTHRLSVFSLTSYSLPASVIELMDPVMNAYLSTYLPSQKTSLASCSLSSALAVTTIGVGVGLGARVGCSVDVIFGEGADGTCLAVPSDWVPLLSEKTAPKIISKTNNASRQPNTIPTHFRILRPRPYRRLTLTVRNLAALQRQTTLDAKPAIIGVQAPTT